MKKKHIGADKHRRLLFGGMAVLTFMTCTNMPLEVQASDFNSANSISIDKTLTVKGCVTD